MFNKGTKEKSYKFSQRNVERKQNEFSSITYQVQSQIKFDNISVLFGNNKLYLLLQEIILVIKDYYINNIKD